ncbi:MAG TPA: hypothetical protein VIV40_31265 [Kofleriaceae bacterium]
MWRASLFVLAACTFDHGVGAGSGDDTPSCTTTPPWWDPAFVARFPLSVSAPPGYTLRVDASQALAAGPDVRVVVHDTQAREIDRLLESPAVTFKVPSSGSIWLYAGPGTGTAKASLPNIFLFAEDFASIPTATNADGPFIPLPANEWNVVDDAGNHVLHAAGIARHGAAIRGLMPADAEISARIRFGAGGGQNHVGLAMHGNSMAADTFDGFVTQLQLDISHWRIAEYINGASPPTELTGIDRAVARGKWYALRMRIIGDTITFFVDDQLVVSTTKAGADGNMIGLFAHNCDVDYDDVRVRMAASPEPTATLGAVQRCE